MKNKKYMCCFCGEPVISSDMDITGLIVKSNRDKALEKQQEQQLFCHMNCLKKSLDINVPLYIADLMD